MKRYTGHAETWGNFVDVKTNAPEVLQKAAQRAIRGKVIISSVTDAYQPIEAKYKLTGSALKSFYNTNPYRYTHEIPSCSERHGSDKGI